MSPDEIALTAAEERFNRAMVSNNADAIRACITPDWMLVTPESGPVSADDVLAAIASGILGHDSMTKQSLLIRVLGDTAYVTGRGQNTGWFRDAPMQADEWITDIYVRVNGKWLCDLTHLTPAAG